MTTPKKPPRRAPSAASASKSLLAFRVSEKLLDMYPWLFRLAKNAYRERMPPELSSTQFKALLYVVRHGGTPLRRLAHDLGISMAVASTSVSWLATHQLVRIDKDDDDQRQIALWATSAGRAARENASAVARASVAGHLKCLTADDLDLVHRALELLSDVFHHAEPVVSTTKGHRTSARHRSRRTSSRARGKA